MSTPVNPTDILFSVTSHDENLESPGYTPQNIYVNQDEVIYNESLARKKTATGNSDDAFVPSKDKDILLPYFHDSPVIETANFKAYLILAEENLFLQNEAANSRNNRRSRAQRRNLLGLTAGLTNETDSENSPIEDTNPNHSFFETRDGNGPDNTNNNNNSEDSNEDGDDNSSDTDGNDLPPVVLRGILLFRVLKPNTKIKNINLNFKGDSRTNWPEGIPPKKTEFLEIEKILKRDWNFFNSHDHTLPHYNKGGASHINTLPDSAFKKDLDGLDSDNLDLNDTAGGTLASNLFSSLSAVTSNSSQKSSKKSKLFGLSRPKSMMSQLSNKASVFGKSNTSLSSNVLTGVASNGKKSMEINASDADYLDVEENYFDSQGNYIFQPGDYIYNFEESIPQSTPESVSLTFGFVNYWLNLEVARSGKFKSILRAKKKINLIRTNSSQSIEENFDPIMINKTWEDRLSYSILIASNSVILNSFIPINIRLVPTDKNVKLYKIKIFLVEILEYWCKERKVHRLEPQRKFLLLEHKPKVGTNLLKDFEDINFNNDVITDKSTIDKAASQDPSSSGKIDEKSPAPPNDRLISHLLQRNTTDNGIGQVRPTDKKKHHKKHKKSGPAQEDDEEEYISSKDFSYQLYVPETFSKFSLKLHPDTKHKNIQCHHWIKISLRLSKKADDFELSKEANLSEPARELSRALETGAASDTSESALGPVTSNPANGNAAHNGNGNGTANGNANNTFSTRRSSIAHSISKRKSVGGNEGNKKDVKRKHYEISIDSPISVLHPLCTQANTLLPAYDGSGLYDPYTYARKKSTGEIEILTNNNPLFPPEILGNNNLRSENALASKHISNIANDEVQIVNPLDAYKLTSKPAVENNADKNNLKSVVPTGDNYNTLDNEFQSEVTLDMISSNLYQPTAIDLDLASPQAVPMKPHNSQQLSPPPVALSPVSLARNNENIDNLLSPKTTTNGDVLQVSPIQMNLQLSPNFRALSPTLQALSPPLHPLSPQGKSTALSIKSPRLMAHADYPMSITGAEREIDSSMHLLSKPPIKPPTYKQTIGTEATINNKVLNNLLIENGAELVSAPPPPTYEDVVKEKDQIKTLRRFKNAAIDDDDPAADLGEDSDGDDVANRFTFRGSDPNIPQSVTRAASPKITTESLSGILSTSNNGASSSTKFLGENSSSVSTGLLNERGSLDNNAKALNTSGTPLYNDRSHSSEDSGIFDDSTSSLAAATPLENTGNTTATFSRTDKLPLLTESEQLSGNSSSLSLKKTQTVKYSNKLNMSLTSLWNPIKNYNVTNRKEQEKLPATAVNGIFHNFEDDSKNDLGLQ